MSSRRIAGGAGVLFVVMNVIAGLAPGKPPDFNEPIDKLLQYVVEKDSQLVGGAFVGAISSVFVLVLLVGLWRILRQGEGEGFDFATVFLASGVATTAVATVGTALMAVPAFESEQLGTPSKDIVRFAADASGLTFVLMSGLVVALLLAAAVSIFRGKTLPSWLAWLGVLAAACEIAAGLGITGEKLYKAAFPLGFLPIMVWFLAASVVLLTGRDDAVAG
jgi:hypothetical protein